MPELIPDLSQPQGWLPLAFMVLMGLSILAYVILDGFDLGVGMLLAAATAQEKDVMISSIVRSGMPTKPGSCWVSGSCWWRFPTRMEQ